MKKGLLLVTLIALLSVGAVEAAGPKEDPFKGKLRWFFVSTFLLST